MIMKKSKTHYKFVKSNQEFKLLLEKAFQHIIKYFDDNDTSKSHSLKHTIRIANSCFGISKKIGGALDVLLTAALFHDVGRAEEEKTGKCHAEISASIAESFLREQGLEGMTTEVCDAIKSHRFSKKIAPKFKEGKILKDADALDALGAIGLYRTISFATESGVELEEAVKHFDDKLLKLPSLMHFKYTRRIAKKECKILIKFENGIKSNLKESNFEMLMKKL